MFNYHLIAHLAKLIIFIKKSIVSILHLLKNVQDPSTPLRMTERGLYATADWSQEDTNSARATKKPPENDHHPTPLHLGAIEAL